MASEGNLTREQGRSPGYLYAVSDCIFLAYEAVVYAAALAGPLYLVLSILDGNPLIVLASSLGGYLAAAIVFPSVLIVTKRVFLRDVPTGRFVLSGKRVIRWILADRLVKIMARSPFYDLVMGISFLRCWWLRGMGARVDLTFMTGSGVKIPEPWALRAGRHVLVGDDAVLSGHKGEHNVVTLGDVEIGDNVLIGAGSLVFPGVRIGNGTTIGAHSVVTRGTLIPPGETWAGNPARKVALFPSLPPTEEPAKEPAHAPF